MGKQLLNPNLRRVPTSVSVSPTVREFCVERGLELSRFLDESAIERITSFENGILIYKAKKQDIEKMKREAEKLELEAEQLRKELLEKQRVGDEKLFVDWFKLISEDERKAFIAEIETAFKKPWLWIITVSGTTAPHPEWLEYWKTNKTKSFNDLLSG